MHLVNLSTEYTFFWMNIKNMRDLTINKTSNFEMCNITLRQNIMECHPGQILSNKYKWFDFKYKSVDSEIQII